jgi:hypothetical protein
LPVTVPDRVSVADIFQAMGDRAFGALDPDLRTAEHHPHAAGHRPHRRPLVFLSAQLMLGQSPWLPKIIAERSMTRGDFASIVSRISPWLARGERMLLPRLGFLIYPPAEYIIGLLCLILSTVLILPVPLGNILPAIAICLFSFGILERTALRGAGAAMTVVSLTVVAGVLFALSRGFILLLTTTIF